MIDLFAPPTDEEIEERKAARQYTCHHGLRSSNYVLRMRIIDGKPPESEITYVRETCALCGIILKVAGDINYDINRNASQAI